MPELPDVTVYIEALEARIRGAVLLSVRLPSPFVLRSVDPPLHAATGRTVTGLRRLASASASFGVAGPAPLPDGASGI